MKKYSVVLSSVLIAILLLFVLIKIKYNTSSHNTVSSFKPPNRYCVIPENGLSPNGEVAFLMAVPQIEHTQKIFGFIELPLVFPINIFFNESNVNAGFEPGYNCLMTLKSPGITFDLPTFMQGGTSNDRKSNYGCIRWAKDSSAVVIFQNCIRGNFDSDSVGYRAAYSIYVVQIINGMPGKFTCLDREILKISHPEYAKIHENDLKRDPPLYVGIDDNKMDDNLTFNESNKLVINCFCNNNVSDEEERDGMIRQTAHITGLWSPEQGKFIEVKSIYVNRTNGKPVETNPRKLVAVTSAQDVSIKLTGSDVKTEDAALKADTIFVGEITAIGDANTKEKGVSVYRGVKIKFKQLLRLRDSFNPQSTVTLRVFVPSISSHEDPPQIGNSYIFFIKENGHGESDPYIALKLLPDTYDNIVKVKQLIGARPDDWYNHIIAEAKAGRGKAQVPLIIAMIDGPDSDNRCAGAQLIEFYIGKDAKDAVPSLIRHINDHDQDWEARLRCVQAFGKIGPDASSAIPDLMNLLNDPDWLIVDSAIYSLSAMGPKAEKAKPILEEILKRPKNSERYGSLAVACRVALARITQNPKPQIDALIAMLKEKDDYDTANLPVLEALRGLIWLAPESKIALPSITQVMLNPKYNFFTRGEAASDLGYFRDVQSVPYLQQIIYKEPDFWVGEVDTDWLVRDSAIDALKVIQGDKIDADQLKKDSQAKHDRNMEKFQRIHKIEFWVICLISFGLLLFMGYFLFVKKYYNKIIQLMVDFRKCH